MPRSLWISAAEKYVTPSISIGIEVARPSQLRLVTTRSGASRVGACYLRLSCKVKPCREALLTLGQVRMVRDNILSLTVSAVNASCRAEVR